MFDTKYKNINRSQNYYRRNNKSKKNNSDKKIMSLYESLFPTRCVSFVGDRVFKDTINVVRQILTSGVCHFKEKLYPYFLTFHLHQKKIFKTFRKLSSFSVKMDFERRCYLL